MTNPLSEQELRQVAEAVRQACLTAALDAYEQGGFAGLCAEGRWELALDAIRALDVGKLLPERDERINPSSPELGEGQGRVRAKRVKP